MYISTQCVSAYRWKSSDAIALLPYPFTTDRVRSHVQKAFISGHSWLGLSLRGSVRWQNSFCAPTPLCLSCERPRCSSATAWLWLWFSCSTASCGKGWGAEEPTAGRAACSGDVRCITSSLTRRAPGLCSDVLQNNGSEEPWTFRAQWHNTTQHRKTVTCQMLCV